MKRTWYKYTEKWASGHGYTGYKVFWVSGDDDASVKEWFEELAHQYDYSEMFRGIDWEVVDVPPSDFLLNELKNTRQKIGTLTHEVHHLSTDVDKALKEEKRDG